MATLELHITPGISVDGIDATELERRLRAIGEV